MKKPENERAFEIRPLKQRDVDTVLEVYRQCEDFLALGPVPTASLDMVLEDMGHSLREGSLFCGIFLPDGQMVGVVDYLSGGYQSDPQLACLYLLMIAVPYRGRGLGQAVVAEVERAIRAQPGATAIIAGVQVNNPRAVQFWLRQGYRITSGPTRMPDRTTVYSLRKDLREE
jgi:ribosomal protein S18 acetylase RimI-like enzyme